MFAVSGVSPAVCPSAWFGRSVIKVGNLHLLMGGYERSSPGKWKSVKYEEVYLKAYETVSEPRRPIGAFLEFYDVRRPHSSLDRMTSDQFYFAALTPPMAA